MNKKYIVRLSAEEREILEDIIKKLKGSSEKVRRAHILLKVDADGPNWADVKIAEAFSCTNRTVETIRKRFVTKGFESVLNGKKREAPPRKKLLDGEQEAKIIAMRLGTPPKGFGSWSLRLLTDRIIELEIIESVCHETIRKSLKKME